MSRELGAPPWANKEEMMRLEPEGANSNDQCPTCEKELETIDFNLVKGELESLERKMAWKKRFKLIFSLIFVALFAVLIYMMPLSIGLSIASLGGLFVHDSAMVKILAVLGAAFTSLLISLIVGFGRLGTLGLTASSAAPIFYLANIKALILAYVAF